MSIAEKFEVIADAVYEKGKEDTGVDFWKGFTNNGSRTNYYQAFMYTDFSGKTIPEGLCKPKNRLTNMFMSYKGTCLPSGIDCSNFNISSSETYHATAMFQYADRLIEIYDLGIPTQKSYANTFSGCESLRTIEVIRSNVDTKWNNTFLDCLSLSNLVVEGNIGQNGFDVSKCPLTHDSLMSILNATAVITTAKTLTLGSANLAKLSDAEKAIATERGWTLA